MTSIGNDKNCLSFFETPSKISKLIYSHLEQKESFNILDLGAGKGALLRPIIKNKHIHRVAIEINENLRDDLLLSYDEVYIDNVLESSIRDIVPFLISNYIYISNPPFSRINCTSELQHLLFSQGLTHSPRLFKSLRSELVFIARVLESAKIGDEAAFIIPTTLLESSEFRTARETLVTKHNLHTCFILPSKAFKKTEVRTSIVWFRPYGGIASKAVQILQSNAPSHLLEHNKFIKNGIAQKEIEINVNNTLSSLIISIKRGKSSKNSLLQRNIDHIHTSDISRRHAKTIHSISMASSKIEPSLENVAQDGDILIARVGTRVLGKTAIFSGKDKVISDCVVRLRVADYDRNYVFNKLVSEKGQNWLKDVASGSCARILTYNAINNFPITI